MLKRPRAWAERQRRLWMWAPVFAVSVIVFGILAIDLAFGGADNEEPLNLAPSPAPLRTVTPRPRTVMPLIPTASPTPPPTATREPGPAAHIRDETRKNDLRDLREGLERYRQEKGEYPSTSGNVQTACVYDVDALCKLKKLVVPFPEDPLGDPGKNGYWYVSDGKTYLLVAAMEVPENASPADACPAEVREFTGKTHLLCVPGP